MKLPLQSSALLDFNNQIPRELLEQQADMMYKCVGGFLKKKNPAGVYGMPLKCIDSEGQPTGPCECSVEGETSDGKTCTNAEANCV